uniref:PrB n=1 Tax=Schistosoma mansoni TaxID=6183 RepID=A0JI76_SCHMA|nr:PrB [Schistosoma mansoni]
MSSWQMVEYQCSICNCHCHGPGISRILYLHQACCTMESQTILANWLYP